MNTKDEQQNIESQTRPQIIKGADANLKRALGAKFLRLYELRNTIGEYNQIYEIDDTMFPVLHLDVVNSLVDYIVVFQFLEKCAAAGAIAEKIFTGSHMWVVIDQKLYAEICREYGFSVDAFKAQ